MVTVSECASHAVADAAMGAVVGKGAGEQSLARKLYRRLDEDWLLIADRNFFNWADWCTAADTGVQLLWRVKELDEGHARYVRVVEYEVRTGPTTARAR